MYKIFLMLKISIFGLMILFFNSVAVFADDESVILEGIPKIDAPYIINVRQLTPPYQVEMYTNAADEDRNVTTGATKGYIQFNFRPSNIFSYAYVKIVENATNLKVLEGNMGKQGYNYSFNIRPNMFRKNNYYTIYQSEHQAGFGKPIGSFFVTDSKYKELSKPVVNRFTNEDTKITGTGEPNTTAVVFIGGDSPYKNKVDSKGDFSVELPKKYEAGIKYRAYVIDDQGNKSEDTVGFVEKADLLAPPTINRVLDTDVHITGEGKPNTKIVFEVSDEDKYRDKVDSTGKYAIKLDHSYPVGTKLVAYLVDDNNHKSHEVISYVERGESMLGVNKILTSDPKITGTALPDSTIEIEINSSRGRVYTGVSDEQGNFAVDLQGSKYSAGTRVRVEMLENDVSIDFRDVIIYPTNPTVYGLRDGDNCVVGKGEASAEIFLTINNMKYSGKADNGGNFNITVPSLKAGQRMFIYQKSNGIKSDVVELRVRAIFGL